MHFMAIIFKSTTLKLIQCRGGDHPEKLKICVPSTQLCIANYKRVGSNPKIPIVYAELQTALKLGTVQTSNSLITMFIYRTELKTHPNLPKHSEIQISNSSTGFLSNTRQINANPEVKCYSSSRMKFCKPANVII